MAFSYNEVGPVDPGFTTVTLTFPFLERIHVSVSVDKIVLADNAWSWNSDTQIELNDPLVGGEVVKAFRTTPAAGVQADFQPGAFDYEELNTSLLHLLYIVQEAYDNSSVAVEAGNNAFSYLMQIEDLVDDAVILFGDMQGLYAAYDTQADAALVALSLARSNALTDLANALSTALAAISTDRTAALAAITTALNAALVNITTAQNTATTAINALVTIATTQAGIATAEAGEASTSATNAATSEANAAASVVGAVKVNAVQTFTGPEKLQAKTNVAAVGYDGQVLTAAEQQAARKTIGMEFGYPIIHVVDEKPNSTDGGSTLSGTMNVRVLNTVRVNEISGASLASNAITLPAGTYDLEAWAPEYQSGRSALYFYNVTDGVTLFSGSTAMYGGTAGGGAGGLVFARLHRLTLASPKAIGLRHWMQLSDSIGFGAAAGSGAAEVFAQLIARKVK